MSFKNAMLNGVVQRLKTDRAYRDVACKAMDCFQGDPKLWGFFDTGEKFSMRFKDVYVQALSEDSISFEETILAAFAWQLILNGELIYRFIHVRSEPFKDEMMAENQDILDDAVRYYHEANAFDIREAKFYGGKEGADGFVEFAAPFVNGLGQSTNANGTPVGPPRGKVGEKTFFPLEVGYCRPHQVIGHLAKYGCVARFPYGYDKIVFIEDTKFPYRYS